MNGEFLTSEELEQLTGRKRLAAQKNWLDKNGWIYAINAAGRLIVSRYYAREKLAGMQYNSNNVDGWSPDFSVL